MLPPPRIFDSHTHAFPDRIAASAMRQLTAEATWLPVFPCHDGTVSGLLGAMDAAGVEVSIMCGVATKPAQVQKITDWCAQVASPRVVPFASIHPDFDAVEAEVERIASLGLKGIKFHSQYMNCPADDPRVLRIARAAARCGLAMTFHSGHDLAFPRSDIASPARLRRLHELVPDLRLLCCHMGGWHYWDESLALLAGLPIYLETSYSLGMCEPTRLEQILAKHPREFLLFGTDSPWLTPADELRKFRALPLDRDPQRLALWDNAWRYLGLPVPDGRS